MASAARGTAEGGTRVDQLLDGGDRVGGEVERHDQRGRGAVGGGDHLGLTGDALELPRRGAHRSGMGRVEVDTQDGQVPGHLATLRRRPTGSVVLPVGRLCSRWSTAKYPRVGWGERPTRSASQRIDGTMASITAGPGSARARASWSPSSSAVVARVAGTPRPGGERDEVDVGPRQVEQALGLGPRRLGADPVELHVEHRVRPVVVDDRHDVEPLAGLRPQRLEGVRARCRRPAGLTTWRSGQATAAPVATGMPWPIAPPVRHSQSCGGAPAVRPGANRLDVLPSSDTIAPSGRRAATAWATLLAVSSPVGQVGALGGLERGAVGRGADGFGQGLEGRGRVRPRRWTARGPRSRRAPGRWPCPG